MVFLIVDKDRLSRILLVKAETREALTERIKLKETEEIVGSLTSNELDALHSTAFGVITA